MVSLLESYKHVGLCIVYWGIINLITRSYIYKHTTESAVTRKDVDGREKQRPSATGREAKKGACRCGDVTYIHLDRNRKSDLGDDPYFFPLPTLF